MSAYLSGRRLLGSVKIILVCSFLTFLSLGCSPKTQIVLLPDPDGKVGRIELTNPERVTNTRPALAICRGSQP